jgi:hypothetical protein
MPNHLYYGDNRGVKMSLTEICHSIAIDAYHQYGKKEEAYMSAYYTTLSKLHPDHPVFNDISFVDFNVFKKAERESRHKQGLMDV